MSIRFDPTTDTQKQCTPPLLNPTFDKKSVPILNYTNQMRLRNRNNACSNDDAPYLYWDEENSKYCCSNNIQDVDLVLNKIKEAIEHQAQNSCSLSLYNKYRPYINALLRDYLIIYKNTQSSLVSAEELEELLIKKKAELLELSTYRPDVSASCSDNPADLGEDDEELMRNLQTAQENAPKSTSSNFFDKMGGRKLQKKSKKQTKNRKYRKSAKRYN